MGSACQPQQSLSRELIPVGNGLVLAWESDLGLYQLYQVGRLDGPLGAGPITDRTDGYPHNVGGLLYAAAPLRVIQTSPLTTGFNVIPIVTAPTESSLGAFLATSSWPQAFWGHEIVPLDGDNVLEWWLGSGSYTVFQYDRANETTAPLKQTNYGGLLPALRRGARVANLGQGRLLTWTPATGKYEIWPYQFDVGTGDIFGASPIAQGSWTDPGPGDDLLITDVDSALSPTGRALLVWGRPTGRVRLIGLDPTAPDPMSGPLLAERVYPSLVQPDWNPPRQSEISNALFVLQRGRSFDSYFGQYCTAEPGSNPTCEAGPVCCEAAPQSIPGAASCTPLDPSQDAYTPDASLACMQAKIDGGQMDKFADASSPAGCGDPRDFVCSGTGPSAGAVSIYQTYASQGALSDRTFQSSLDPDPAAAIIYLNKASYGFSISTESGKQITGLMADAHVRWALYLESPMDVLKDYGQIPPQFFDPHWTFFRGLDELPRDIELQQLPDVSIVISGKGQTEQPGDGPPNAGITFVKGIVDAVTASPVYSKRALTIVTHLTTGGFFDHVQPPAAPPPAIDSQMIEGGDTVAVQYGMRVPLIALGPFARAGAISHTQLELSSLTVFLEWNWLGADQVGRLHHRDATAANIGSLLDPAQTGVPVPEGVKAP
jgi:hypothetical protein